MILANTHIQGSSKNPVNQATNQTKIHTHTKTTQQTQTITTKTKIKVLISSPVKSVNIYLLYTGLFLLSSPDSLNHRVEKHHLLTSSPAVLQFCPFWHETPASVAKMHECAVILSMLYSFFYMTSDVIVNFWPESCQKGGKLPQEAAISILF